MEAMALKLMFCGSSQLRLDADRDRVLCRMYSDGMARVRGVRLCARQDGRTDRQRDGLICGETVRQSVSEPYRQTDRKTERQKE